MVALWQLVLAGVGFTLALPHDFSAHIDHSEHAVLRTGESRLGVQDETDRTLSRGARRALDEVPPVCDVSLMQCFHFETCHECFKEMKQHNIDWATFSGRTTCDGSLAALWFRDICMGIRDDLKGKAAFCEAFDACVQHPRERGYLNVTKMDCSILDICDFPGFHPQFLGDGICQDMMYGCYNSAACGWDGGDCCEDTCSTADHGPVKCGQEPFYCRDPQSSNCDQELTRGTCTQSSQDANYEPESDDFVDIACGQAETTYRLVMYDSLGDGWDETTLNIKKNSLDGEMIYSGSLVKGAIASDFLCLENRPACYWAEAKGGVFGKQISWEIKPARDGASSIASGKAPTSCSFPIFGADCKNTCTGQKSDLDPSQDPTYQDFDSLRECVEGKCPIQLKMCHDDDLCLGCYNMKDSAQAFCYDLDTYNDIVTCALCNCAESEKRTDFCMDNHNGSKDSPGANSPARGSGEKEAPCTPSQTVAGGNAMLEFNVCTNFDKLGMLLVHFDQNNFGDIDVFERCAHAFQNEPNHGGHTALNCMQILQDVADGTSHYKVDNPRLMEAIFHLAYILFHNADKFCECVVSINEDTPMCPAFVNFKTLMYEAVDACRALDEIDCDAWNEFYKPCRTTMEAEFGSIIDFQTAEQCDFVQNGCGGAGGFPAFRRLDCGATHETNMEAWVFYLDYERECLDNDQKSGSVSIPSTAGAISPSRASRLVPQSYGQGSASTTSEKKPYVPPEKRKKGGSEGNSSPTSSPLELRSPIPQPTGADNKSESSKKSYVPPEDRNKKGKYVPPEHRDKKGSAPVPTSKPSSSTQYDLSSNSPTYRAPAANSYDSSSSKKKYIPPEKRTSPKSGDSQPKRKSHFFRNFFLILLLGGLGYYGYQTYMEEGFDFDFRRFLRRRQFSGEMYTGLSMQSSTTFEPPSMPPATGGPHAQQFI